MHRSHEMTRAAGSGTSVKGHPAREAAARADASGAPVPVGQRPRKPLRVARRLTLVPSRPGVLLQSPAAPPSGASDVAPTRSSGGQTGSQTGGQAGDRIGDQDGDQAGAGTGGRASSSAPPAVVPGHAPAAAARPGRDRAARVGVGLVAMCVAVGGGLLLGRMTTVPLVHPPAPGATAPAALLNLAGVVPRVDDEGPTLAGSVDAAVEAGFADVADDVGDEGGGTGKRAADASVEGSRETDGAVAGEPVERGSVARSADGEPADDGSGIDVGALVLENRELAAEVETLEVETTELHGELLTLELRVAALSGPGATDGAAIAPDDGVTDIVIVGEADGAYDDTAYDEGTTYDDHTTYDDEVAVSSDGLHGPEHSASDEPMPDGPLPGAPVSFRSDDSGFLADQPVPDSAAAGRSAASATAQTPIERLVIAETPPGSAAESAGLMNGDVLMAVDDMEIGGFADLLVYDDGLTGHVHEVEVLRDEQRLQLVLGDTPAALSLRAEWFDPEILGY